MTKTLRFVFQDQGQILQFVEVEFKGHVKDKPVPFGEVTKVNEESDFSSVIIGNLVNLRDNTIGEKFKYGDQVTGGLTFTTSMLTIKEIIPVASI